jgi:hypothetical protein
MFFALALFLLFMFGFWAFIVWDRKRLQNLKVTPLPREVMNRGFKPNGVAAWQIWLAVSALDAVLAVAEWYSPSKPPFSGRWSWINAAFYQNFGERGMFAAYCAAACLCVSYGLVLAWRRKL